MKSEIIPPDSLLVIFGANGDLSKRKLLPALYHLDVEGLLPERWHVLGTARSQVSDEEFRELARTAITDFGKCEPEGQRWERFAQRLTFVSTRFSAENTHELTAAISKAEGKMGGAPEHLLVYLSTPPQTFGPITEGLGVAGLAKRCRVVFEKPFGMDRRSFEELDELVQRELTEEQTYRIDHFLGKETVQNILAFRFANGAFEATWNRAHIDHVQIDVPEQLGVEERAGFYDRAGALRDMLVTHLFQVLSVIAMEPPTRLESGPLIDEKVKVFQSMRDLRPQDVVLGQYRGYTSEDGVPEDSTTETFVAARVFIDNWRWDGVPFYLRTGKKMAEKRQTVTLAFRPPPATMFPHHTSRHLGRDRLTFELGGDGGVEFTFLAKKPGPSIELGSVSMSFDYGEAFGSGLIDAYERLIHDALLGDRTLFTRADGIAATWDLLEEVLTSGPSPLPYEPGSWGPHAAMELIAPRHWYLPDHPAMREEVTP